MPSFSASKTLRFATATPNLCPDKQVVFAEIFRVLKPGGRIQIADIVVQRPVPEDAKEDVSLWTG